jgi:hypothetical protein
MHCRLCINYYGTGQWGRVVPPPPAPAPPPLQSTHRVATAAFWRTFYHDGKISPGLWEWELHVHLPLSQYLPSRSKLQCTLQLKGRYNPPISSLPLDTLCHTHSLAGSVTINAKTIVHFSAGSFMQYRDGIFKPFRSPGIYSNESSSPAYVVRRSGTTTLFLLGSQPP